MRLICSVLVWIALSVSNAVTAQQDCPICEMEIESKVHWGRHVFCSEGCRSEFYLDRFRCKICNERVDPPRTTTRSDGMYTYVSAPRKWDGFCDGCREGVKDGQIDPVADRYREEEDTRPSPVPMTETESEPVTERQGERRGWTGLGYGIELLISVGLGLVFWFGKQQRAAG